MTDIDDFWEPDLLKNVYRAFIYRIKRIFIRIKCLYKFLILGWRYEDYSYHSILNVLLTSLKLNKIRMVKANMPYVGIEKDIKKLSITIELLERMVNENHKFKRQCQIEADILWDRYELFGIRFKPELKLNPEIKNTSKQWNKYMRTIDILEENEAQYFFKLFNKHLRRWWV